MFLFIGNILCSIQKGSGIISVICSQKDQEKGSLHYACKFSVSFRMKSIQIVYIYKFLLDTDN